MQVKTGIFAKQNWLNALKLAMTNKIAQVLLGSLFLAFMSKLSLPLYFSPVPISMQSLAVTMLAIFLPPTVAFMSVILYLFEATIGLPVISSAGGLNPAWLIGPTSGYLIGFAASAFTVSKLLRINVKSSTTKKVFILLLSEVIIIALGIAWLSWIMGFNKALYLGAIPFIPGAVIKTAAASIMLERKILVNKLLK